jgi:hypothetical protein
MALIKLSARLIFDIKDIFFLKANN